MTYMGSPQSNALEDSQRLITLLEGHAVAPSPAYDALARQRELHRDLEAHQIRSEQTLAAWRAALTRRWKCEVEGQRQYMRIIQQLRAHYGPDSPQMQALISSNDAQTGTASELLHDMRRMYAALLLIQPSLPFDAEHVHQLEAACNALDEALTETQHWETKRRQASIERRMADEACRRAIADATRLLEERSAIRQTVPQTNGVYARHEVGLF
jgi:hypothetical protein